MNVPQARKIPQDTPSPKLHLLTVLFIVVFTHFLFGFGFFSWSATLNFESWHYSNNFFVDTDPNKITYTLKNAVSCFIFVVFDDNFYVF